MSYFCKYKLVSQAFRHPTFEGVKQFRAWVKTQDDENAENWVENASLPKEFIYTSLNLGQGDEVPSFRLDGIGWLLRGCMHEGNTKNNHPTHCDDSERGQWHEHWNTGIKSFAPPDNLPWFEQLAQWFDFVFFVTGEEHPWVGVNNFLKNEKVVQTHTNMWVVEGKSGKATIRYLKFTEVTEVETP